MKTIYRTFQQLAASFTPRAKIRAARSRPAKKPKPAQKAAGT